MLVVVKVVDYRMNVKIILYNVGRYALMNELIAKDKVPLPKPGSEL